MESSNTEYRKILITADVEMTEFMIVGVTSMGRADTLHCGYIHHITDPDANMADYWTLARLSDFLPGRSHSDAVMVGGELVFVGALERLALVAQFFDGSGLRSLAGQPLKVALGVLEQATDEHCMHLPTLGGHDVFGQSYAM